MAKITLSNLAHSYMPRPSSDEDWALKQLDLEWADGGAYALLGPSGCGKTTLLNIISGLLCPSEGSILFDGVEVNDKSPEERQIAQVFQFPVVYDTMTVYDNLAFPLRNRGASAEYIKGRVQEIATLIGLEDELQRLVGEAEAFGFRAERHGVFGASAVLVAGDGFAEVQLRIAMPTP